MHTEPAPVNPGTGILAFSISIIILTSLIFSSIGLYFLYAISQLATDPGNMATIVSNTRLCMIIIFTGLVIIAIFCLVIWKMLGYLAMKHLTEVDSIFKRLAEGHVDWSEDIPDLRYP